MTFNELEHMAAVAQSRQAVMMELYRPLTLGEWSLYIAGIAVVLGLMALLAAYAPTVFFVGLAIGFLLR